MTYTYFRIKKQLKDYLKELILIVPKYIEEANITKDELVLTTKPWFIIPLLSFLKNHTNCLFKLLIDITAVDFPEKENRFKVVYILTSLTYNLRIRVQTYVNEITPIHSVTSLYNAAGWFEREVWDLFGIFFVEHPDLRRILTDYGFQGYPLRKDFPLSGYVEVRYDDEEKRVVCEPIEMTQEFRSFDFLSPWEQNKLSS